MVSGCTTALPAWVPFTGASEQTAQGTGTTPGREGALNARTSRAGQSADAEALYQLGLAQADPTSSLRDYRAARATFTRLLSEFPLTPRTAEARAWQATLTDLLVREDEARRYAQRLQRVEEESKRAKTDIERLKQTDLDLERRR